jgi:hypothetical protein
MISQLRAEAVLPNAIAGRDMSKAAAVTARP